MKLAEEKCVPCEVGGTPMPIKEAQALAREVPAWVLKEKAIEREFRFKNFREGMAFVNNVAEIAEEEGHHPDIFISYNRVRMTLMTHKIGGLSRNDFILAAKIDGAADHKTNAKKPQTAKEQPWVE
jgi:4a-hydroxytetrahydrobiopterin dehydratase